ncbi:OmpA family protein [Cellulophaga sp. Hel_I_12]|uniref:OmpA family protein n=1 Tax=Cellulophaga sp. Hel_I_12 TaxID=1249972 RepID=UPI00068BB863|nr:OmpA family protein [Cellulophaga sp. Hel_I_12]
MKIFFKLLYVFFGLANFLGQSQNLVKNPSFEAYHQCPKEYGSLSLDATDWKIPSLGTTDYFHTCSQELPVENNFIGSQLPFDGDAYAGMYMYAPNDYREYITASLNTPLTQGKLYKVSFLVNLADKVEFAVNRFDVLLSKAAFEMSTSKYIDLAYLPADFTNNFKEITNSTFYNNTEDWTQISTTFVAKGNERFLTIGNFKSNESTMVEVVKKTSKKSAYYFIDMVSVEAMPFFNLNELYVFDDVLFDFDETTIEIKYSRQLNDLVAYLEAKPSLKVNLYGHTDALGSDDYNDTLSHKRAETIANFLIKAGVPKNRIEWKGFGLKKPIVDNNEETLRFKNRRVEFLISELHSDYAKTVYED